MSENIQVYKAINSVQIALVKEGIAKDRTCQQGGSFKYRGIDDVYNVLAGLLADNKLVILPRVLTHTYAERTSNAGKTLFHSTVSVEYDFISAEDGSKHVVGPISGEAMDSGDKSAGKAMSYAYKAMAFQAFAIPTEGDNDPDSQAHVVANHLQEKNINNTKKSPDTGKKHADPGREYVDSLIDWVDGFVKKDATINQFQASWDKAVAGFKKNLSPEHFNELEIAMKDTSKFLAEKETKK